MTKHYLSKDHVRLERGVPLPETKSAWLKAYASAGLTGAELSFVMATMREDEEKFVRLHVDEGTLQKTDISFFEAGRIIGALEGRGLIRKSNSGLLVWEPVDASYRVEDATFVYAVSNGDAVKIGISDSPLKRINQVDLRRVHNLKFLALRAFHQTYSPAFTSRHVALTVERYVHDHFSGNRLEGEWFDVTEASICDAIFLIKAATGEDVNSIKSLLGEAKAGGV